MSFQSPLRVDQVRLLIDTYTRLFKGQAKLLDRLNEVIERSGKVIDKYIRLFKGQAKLLGRLNEVIERSGKAIDRLNEVIEMRSGKVIHRLN